MADVCVSRAFSPLITIYKLNTRPDCIELASNKSKYFKLVNVFYRHGAAALNYDTAEPPLAVLSARFTLFGVSERISIVRLRAGAEFIAQQVNEHSASRK